MTAKINILSLIDFEEVNKLLEGFNQLTGFVTAILDLEGNVLSKSGWRQICTQFHRTNPKTSKNCNISDTILANELGNGEKYHFYKCLNGLVDVAVPIIIKGEHIANLFSGQFFFEEPNRDYFKNQAEKFGFNEHDYFSALEKVPVVSKEKVKIAMEFLLNMTQLISEMTYKKLEQVKLNKALVKSEERFKGAFDNMLEGCQIIGHDWRYIYLNHSAEIHNRRNNNELLGNRYQDMWPGIEKTEIFKIIERVLETRIPYQLENEFVFPNGKIGWFNLSIQPVQEGVFILSIDITERKNVEIALSESEEKYRMVSDNSDDWIYWKTSEGEMKYVSPACERVTGYSPSEFKNNPELIHEIVFEADEEIMRNHTQIPQLDDTPHNLEFRIRTKSGDICWINHSCSPIFSKSGEFLGRRGTNQNITERKLQEQQLYESEFRFNKLYENGPFGMVMADKEFRFKRANPAFCEIMDYSESELQQLTFKDISLPDDLLKDMVYVKKLMNKEMSVYKTEKRYIRKDGQTIWGSLTLSATYDSEGQFLYNLGIIEDITHRKQAEEYINKSRQLLTETESVGKVGGWEINIDTLRIDWTDEVYRIHEVDFDFDPNVNKGISFYAPASKPIIEAAVEKAIQFGESFDLELEIITGKGNLRKVHTIGKSDLENRRVYGFFQDITERKHAEEQLLKTRNQLENIFETSPGIVCSSQLRTDGTVCFPYGAERLETYFGIPNTHLDVDATPYFELIHPDDITDLLASIQKSASDLTPWRYEWRMLHPVKGLMWIEGHSMPVREEDGSTFWHGVATDITERKQSEEDLRQLNERISTATRASQVGIWDWDIENNVLEWDDQMYALNGLKKGEFAGAYEAWQNGLHPDDKEFSINQTELALTGEKEYDTEFRVVWPDGSPHFIKAKGEVFRNEMGNPIRMVGINFDITEQKRKDEKIREKDMEFRKLSANVPDMIYQFIRKPDGTYCVPIASEGIRNIFGCTPEDVLNDFTPIGKVIYPEDAERVIREIEYSAEHLTFFTCEFRVQIPGREIQWIYSKSSPERLPDGSISWYGFNTDITQKKQAEEALKVSEEKFRKIFFTNVDAISITRKEDGRFISTNNGFTKIFGYTEDEIVNKTTLEIKMWLNPDDRMKFVNDLQTNGYTDNFETKLGTKNGKIIDGLISSAFIEIEGVTHILSTTKDITELKQTEEALKKNEAFLREVGRIAVIGGWEFSPVTGEASWTEEVARIHDLDIKTPAEVHKGINYYHGESIDIIRKAVHEIVEFAKPYDLELEIMSAKGVQKWVRTIGHADIENGKVVRVHGSMQDITVRKHAEQALKESEARFRNIFESAVIGIYRTTPEGKILMANPKLINLLGFNSFEELAKRNLENEGFENNSKREDFRKRIEKHGSIVGYESVWKTAEGKSIHVSENAKAFYNDNGDVIYYEGTIEDITERKQIERTLQESEEKFRLAFATNPDAITILRLSDGVFISANNGFTQIFGYSEEEILGKNSLEINLWCNPEDRKNFVAELNTQGKVENFEARLCTKNGQVKEVLISSISLGFEGLPHILSTIKDITDRKQAEQALRESEGKFRKLIESIPLPVAYTNSLGEITFRNNRFLQVMGYTYDEVPTVNEWWVKAYPDENYRQLVIQKWENAVNHAQINNTDIEPAEYNITCKNGTERIMIVSGINIEDNLLITLIDVTDRIRAENKIKELNETLEQRVIERTFQLEAANKEMEAFSYSVSHDLRAPLRHINGYVDLLNDRYLENLPEKARHYLNTITAASKQMGALIDDLLQFSRTGRQELHKSKVDMNALVYEVLEKINPDIINRKIKWTVQKLPESFGDYSLLKQVWINLLDNAVKYSRYNETAEISVEFRNEKEYLVFYVHDNGVGFDMKYAHKLFGVFQRLHSQTDFEGTGIGLANVQRIIHKHNGQVWAEAELNKGATFFFSLPKIK